LGSSLGLNEQDISLKKILIGVHPYLDLVGKGLLQFPWGSSPLEGFIHRIDVGGFILLHAENVGKELELL